MTDIISQYLSVAEFTEAPTGIDVNKLVPSGTTQQNQAALVNVLRRASSMIDSYCNQQLTATVNTETRTHHLNREGFLRVFPQSIPIISVQSLSYRLYPQADWNLVDSSTYQVFYDRIESYNFFSYFGLFWPNLPMPYMPQPLGQPYQPYTTPTQADYIQHIPLMITFTYVNGYPNTVISGATLAGVTTLTVKDATGIIAGNTLTVYDSMNTEDVTVDSVAGNTLTLVGPTEYEHVDGVSISAIPPAVKEACLIFATYLIHQRGQTAIKAAPNGPYQVSTGKEATVDIDMAYQMLKPYRRIVVNTQ